MSEQLTQELRRAVGQAPPTHLSTDALLAEGRRRVRRRRAVGVGALASAAVATVAVWVAGGAGLPESSVAPADRPAITWSGGVLQLERSDQDVVARLDGRQLAVAEGERPDGVLAYELPDNQVLLVADVPVDGSGSTHLRPVLDRGDHAGPSVQEGVEELLLETDDGMLPAVTFDADRGSAVGAVLADERSQGEDAMRLVGATDLTFEIDDDIFVGYLEGADLWLVHRGDGSGPARVADRGGAIAVEVDEETSMLVSVPSRAVVEPRVVGTSRADGGGGAMSADGAGTQVFYFGVDAPAESLRSPEIGFNLAGGTAVDVPVVGVLPIAGPGDDEQPGLSDVTLTLDGDEVRATRGAAALQQLELAGGGVWAWEDLEGTVVVADLPDLHPTTELRPVLRPEDSLPRGAQEPLVVTPSSTLETTMLSVGDEQWPAVWLPRSEQGELVGVLATNSLVTEQTVRVLGGEDVSPDLPVGGDTTVAAARGTGVWTLSTSADLPMVLDGPRLVGVELGSEEWDLVARLPGDGETDLPLDLFIPRS